MLAPESQITKKVDLLGKALETEMEIEVRHDTEPG